MKTIYHHNDVTGGESLFWPAVNTYKMTYRTPEQHQEDLAEIVIMSAENSVKRYNQRARRDMIKNVLDVLPLSICIAGIAGVITHAIMLNISL